MNEVMKWLTILSSVFIPGTFLAGVYGMNFHEIPELQLRHGYGLFWLACLVQIGGLYWYFKKRGWLGTRR
jgi:magnesium transporter